MLKMNLKESLKKARKQQLWRQDWLAWLTVALVVTSVPLTIVVVWLICMEFGLPWDRALFVGGLCGYLKLV